MKLVQWSLTEKKSKRVTPNRVKGTMQQISSAWYHSPLSSLPSLFPPPMKTHACPACPIPQHPSRGFESLPESLSLSFPLFIFFLSQWLWLGLRSDCQVWSMSKIWACALCFALATPPPLPPSLSCFHYLWTLWKYMLTFILHPKAKVQLHKKNMVAHIVLIISRSVCLYIVLRT